MISSVSSSYTGEVRSHRPMLSSASSIPFGYRGDAPRCVRAGGRILSRCGEFFVDESDDEGNADMVGVVGVSNESFVTGSSFARGGIINCELLPDGVADPDAGWRHPQCSYTSCTACELHPTDYIVLMLSFALSTLFVVLRRGAPMRAHYRDTDGFVVEESLRLILVSGPIRFSVVCLESKEPFRGHSGIFPYVTCT
jgi:hypothetical protein